MRSGTLAVRKTGSPSCVKNIIGRRSATRLGDESLGFIKAEDSLDQGAYFRLLTSDARKNEAWNLLPALTANNWYPLWGAESPDDANEVLTERRPYFHGIALEEWRARIGRRDAGRGEIWEALDNDNRLKYFDFFTSFCDSDQKSEVWRRLNDEEKTLLVAREPRWWTTFMLFGSADGLHDNERDEAWSFLSNEVKDDVLVESAFKISAAQRDEAWASASREAKVAVFTYDSRVLLNDEQKREAWSLMTRREKKFAAAYMGITPEETSLFQG